MLRAEHRFDHFLHRLKSSRGIFVHRLLDDAGERLGDAGAIRLDRQMLHQDFARTRANVRHSAGQHLE